MKLENFMLNGDALTPTLAYDAEANHLLFAGRSLPEFANPVYDPVKHWLKKHTGQFGNELKVTFMLEFINSTSLKELATIMQQLEKEVKHGTRIQIWWYYEQFDEDMRETGCDLQELFTELQLTLVAIPDEDENDMTARAKLLLRKLP